VTLFELSDSSEVQVMSSNFQLPEVIIERHSDHYPHLYRDMDRHQRKIAKRVLAGEKGAILLFEVAPVITYGRRTPQSDFHYEEFFYKKNGIDLYPVDRGGLATYHGPGQWVLFIVDHLERLTGDARGVRKAVCGLLQAALEVIKKIDPKSSVLENDRTGVWGVLGKYASVGVHIENRILMHGLCLNVFKTEKSFLGFNPCGLNSEIGFLAELKPELNTDEGFMNIGKELVEKIKSHFYQL